MHWRRAVDGCGIRRFADRVARPKTTVDPRFDASNRNPYAAEEKEASIEHMAKGLMYTPELMQTEKFTQHLNKMVNFGFEEPLLLDRYGDRAAALAQGFRGKEFGIVLNCFARTRHQHNGMLEAFAKSIPPKLPGFDPKALSLTCHAYSKFKSWGKDHPKPLQKLFRRLSQEIPHKLPLFEPQHIANVAHAFASLDIYDGLLFDDICDEFLRRPEEFSAQNLLMLSRAFAYTTAYSTASTSDRRMQLWDTLCQWLIESRVDLSPEWMVHVLNCLSRVHGSKTLFDTFAVDLLSSVRSLSLMSCALLINAFGRVHHYDKALFDAVAQRLVTLINDQKYDAYTESDGSKAKSHPYLLCAVVHSYGKLLEPIPQDLFQTISAHVQKHGDELTPQAWTNLCHGMARLQLSEPTLLPFIVKQIAKRAESFTPEALCVILYSFARLRVRSEMLVYLLSQQLVAPVGKAKTHREALRKLSGQGVGMTLYALAKLQIEDDRLINACKHRTRTLGPTLNEVEVSMITHALTHMGRLDDQVSAVLAARLEDLDAPPQREDDWWENWSPSIDGMAAQKAPTPRTDTKERKAFSPFGGSPFDSFPASIACEEDKIDTSYGSLDTGEKVDGSVESGEPIGREDFEEAADSEDVDEAAEYSMRDESSPELDENTLGEKTEDTENKDNLWTMLEQSNASSADSIKSHFRFSEARQARRKKKIRTKEQ